MKNMRLEKQCPRCGKTYSEYPALSRRDNKTDICNECGVAEAMEDANFAPAYSGNPYWEVIE